jgi:hypothetical protein
MPKGVAKATQIFLQVRDTHVLPKLLGYEVFLIAKTADVTGGKLIAVWSQSISGVSAINPLVASYDIHGRKKEILFLYSVPDNTREYEDYIK